MKDQKRLGGYKMARSVRLPLIMKNGEAATDINSLKDNFDAESVVKYFLDGTLEKWLNERYYEDEAEAITQIDVKDPKLESKLREIFFQKSKLSGQDDFEWKNERLERLKKLTNDEEILGNVEMVAFDQEELAELYDRKFSKIYLCEGEFKIPKSKNNLEYVLLNGAKVTGLPKIKEQKKSSIADIVIEKFEKYRNDELFYLFVDLYDSGSTVKVAFQELDAIHSKSKLERMAYKNLSVVYEEANSYFKKGSEKCLDDKIVKNLLRLINDDMSEILHVIEEMDEDEKDKNAVLIKLLLALSDTDNLQEVIKNLVNEELNFNEEYYDFRELSYYIDLINYLKVDYGIKGYWTYNGWEAYTAMEEELREKTESFVSSSTKAFYEQILYPIIAVAKKQ